MANMVMPIMTDVNAYFDARKGVISTSWKNQTGDIDFQLFNPIQNTDGVEVVGSDTSYGKFTKPYVSGSSRTWYFVFKNVSGVFANWKTIIGNESGTYTCSIGNITNMGGCYIRKDNGDYQTIAESTTNNTFTINNTFTFNRMYIYVHNAKTFNNQIKIFQNFF